MYTIIISYQDGLQSFVGHVTLIGRRVLAYNLGQGILSRVGGGAVKLAVGMEVWYETGRWVMYPPIFKIYLIFPNFQDPKY